MREDPWNRPKGALQWYREVVLTGAEDPDDDNSGRRNRARLRKVRTTNGKTETEGKR